MKCSCIDMLSMQGRKGFLYATLVTDLSLSSCIMQGGGVGRVGARSGLADSRRILNFWMSMP
jgi:hypothetical protein